MQKRSTKNIPSFQSLHFLTKRFTSLLMIAMFILVLIQIVNVALISLAPGQDTILIKIKPALSLHTILQMFLGTGIIIVLSGSLYVIGLIFDWLMLLTNPSSKFRVFYLKGTDTINRWFSIIALTTWSLVSLPELLFNYFTILISIAAILIESRKHSKLLQVKIISHYFLDEAENSSKSSENE